MFVPNSTTTTQLFYAKEGSGDRKEPLAADTVGGGRGERRGVDTVKNPSHNCVLFSSLQ